MGAARIQEEMYGDHTFPDLAEKEEEWGRWHGEDKGDARGLAGAWEEAAENQKEGRSWACTRPGRRVDDESAQQTQSERDGRRLLGSPASFLVGEGPLAQLPSSQFLTGVTLWRREWVLLGLRRLNVEAW